MKNQVGLPDIVTLVSLVLLPWVFYFPVTLGTHVFYSDDIAHFFYPVRLELQRALAEGRLPQWTPYLQFGFPLLAEGQMGTFYVPNVLSVLLAPAHHAVSYTILFNVCWAASGMYLLMRSYRITIAGAFVAAVTLGSGGFFVAHLQHVALLATSAWLPWIILCQHRFWRSRSPEYWLVLAGIAIGMVFLAGFPPLALHVLMGFVAFSAVDAWGWRDESGQTWRVLLPKFLSVTILPVVLGAGIGMIQLLPTVELMGYSIRSAGMGLSFFTSHSLPPSGISQFILPIASLGLPGTGNLEIWSYVGILPLALAGVAIIVRRNRQTRFLFGFALAALVLAFGEFNPVYTWFYYIPLLDRFRVPARFLFLFTFTFAALAAIGFDEMRARLDEGNKRDVWIIAPLGALGVISAFWLTYTLETETWIIYQYWIPTGFMLATIALGFSAWRHGIGRRTFTVAAIVLTLADLTIFAAPFLPFQRLVTPSEVVSIPRSIRQLETGQPSARILSTKLSDVSYRARKGALFPNYALQYRHNGSGIYTPLALQRNNEFENDMTQAMRNLMGMGYYILPLEHWLAWNPTLFDETEPQNGLTLNLLAQTPGIPATPAKWIEIVSYTDQTKDLPEGFVVGELRLVVTNGVLKAYPIRLGVETADWMSQVLPARTAMPMHSQSFPAYSSAAGEFLGRKFIARFQVDEIVTAVGLESNLSDARLMIERITLIEADGKTTSLAKLLRRDDLALVFRSHVVAHWENPDALPRAFIVHRAEYVDDSNALARMKTSDFDPAALVLLSDVSANLLSTINAPANDLVKFVEYRPERVELQAKTDAPGYLVLTDSWYPGWTARVDDIPVQLHRANYMLRAVSLAPGEHTVVFEYRSMSLAIGAVMSLIAVLLCLVVFLRQKIVSSRIHAVQ